MTVQNRISISLDDEEFIILERLSSHTHRSKAELIRTIVEEYLSQNPNRFRLDTPLKVDRIENVVLSNRKLPSQK